MTVNDLEFPILTYKEGFGPSRRDTLEELLTCTRGRLAPHGEFWVDRTVIDSSGRCFGVQAVKDVEVLRVDVGLLKKVLVKLGLSSLDPHRITVRISIGSLVESEPIPIGQLRAILIRDVRTITGVAFGAPSLGIDTAVSRNATAAKTYGELIRAWTL